MSQQNLWGACAHSCLLCPGPDPNSWHPALILALGNHSPPPPVPSRPPPPVLMALHCISSSLQPWHQTLVFLLKPTWMLPSSRSTCHNTKDLDWTQICSDGPRKSWGFGWAVKLKGFPNPEQWRQAVWATSWRVHGKWAVQCRGCDKITSIKITANSPWFLPCPLRSQSSPRPLPLPGSCLHTPCTHNLWQTGPHKPPARLAIGYYL